MNNRSFFSVIVASVALFVSGCSMDDKNEPSLITDPVTGSGGIMLTHAEQELVNSSNEFAFNLFRQITFTENPDQDTKSYIVSPLSITYALGLLNNGAADDTQDQINDVLGFGSTGADSINAFCKKMLDQTPKLDSLTKVYIANTIYMNQGYKLKDDFVRKAKTYYYVEPETRDFHDGQTMDVINRWASDHTEQMIRKVFDQNSFNPEAVSYLLNAIYFKGTWKFKFDKNDTQDEEFIHAGGSKELTIRPMMHLSEKFHYAQTADLQALRLPYGSGSFQMTVLLPIPKENEFINKLPEVPTAQEWQQINSLMKDVVVDVTLPRFETDSDIDLKGIMSKLGMLDAFDSDRADFRNFCDSPTYIGLMKQVAKINLDEEGTEAAAVTAIGMLDTAIEVEPDNFVFYADHPFLYVISEKETGAIFFIGRYTGY